MAYNKSYGKKKFTPRRKTPYTKYAKKTDFTKRVAKIARSVVIKKAEPKHKAIGYGKIELLHNVNSLILLNNSAYMPIEGTGDDERVGDQINVTGFKLKFLLGQKADRPNVTWKITVLSVPKGAGYVYNQWYEATTNCVLLDNLNTDFVKHISTHTWKPHDGSMDNATDEYVYTKTIWIPYRKLLKFGPANGATTHNDNDLYCIMSVFDAYGTLLTDNIAYFNAFQTMYYKDP